MYWGIWEKYPNLSRRNICEKGYTSTDLIGKEGIESYYESVLKGSDGEKLIQVNAKGEQVEVISDSDPEPGDDVYLTIDLELQKTAEEALQQALQKIRSGGTFVSEYGNYSYSNSYPNANVGAAVAVDVKTGDVLAARRTIRVMTLICLQREFLRKTGRCYRAKIRRGVSSVSACVPLSLRQRR